MNQRIVKNLLSNSETDYSKVNWKKPNSVISFYGDSETTITTIKKVLIFPIQWIGVINIIESDCGLPIHHWQFPFYWKGFTTERREAKTLMLKKRYYFETNLSDKENHNFDKDNKVFWALLNSLNGSHLQIENIN